MSSAATARSPSPGPVARPCFGLRRSADSSPFRAVAPTPDSPQRSASVGRTSGGRGSWRAEKENDGNHQRVAVAARTHSKPARHSAGGGAKSFMAPTISAASKAVAASASPRKKVLGERNNDTGIPPASTSGDRPLLPHAKNRASPPVFAEEDLGAPRRLRLSLDGAPAPAPTAAPVVSPNGAQYSLGGEAGEEEEVENPGHHRDQPGDAAAPYDPKTNYLSPRPQFLRYRPNPRVELYRQGGVRRLEDGFASSESSEETDKSDIATTTEEGLSEEEQESSPLAPGSDAGGADPASPAAAGVVQPEPALASPPLRVPTPELEEPAPTSPRARAPTPELEPAPTPARAPAKTKKQKSSLRFLLVAPLALALLVVASLVCAPPAPGSPVVLNASLAKVSDYFVSVQESHPVELAALLLRQWSSSSLDFVSSYWNALASSGQQEFFGPHFATNLSVVVAYDADHSVGFYYSAAETRPMPTEQEPISASILEQEMEIQEVVSASDAVANEEEMATLGDGTVQDEATDAEMVQESVSVEVNEHVLIADMAEEDSVSSGEEMASSDQHLGIPSQSEPQPEHTVDDRDVSSLQQDVQTDESEGEQKEFLVKKDQDSHQGKKSGSDMWPPYLEEFSKPAVVGSVLAVIVVSAALAVLYMRQNQARVSLNPMEPTDDAAEQDEKVENPSGSGSSEGHALAKSSSHFQNPVIEETDRIGGSGASQYSSSLSSGLSKRRKGKEEQSLQSLETMSRRESTGYSTSTYGSFTTYEKIPAKKKNKEDEAMTPVRRSSRLRNQVKSPEA